MHQNHYFLSVLATRLDQMLRDNELVECFSQHKDELILGLTQEKQSRYIRADLNPNVNMLAFPDAFARSRKNSVDLFQEIIGKRIKEVRVHQNERSFELHLGEQYHLVFKLHGSLTNVLLYRGAELIEVFKKNISKDHSLEYSSLDRTLDQGYATFVRNDGNLKVVFPTFGKIPRKYLYDQGYVQADITQKWEMVQRLLDEIRNPLYYITLIDEIPHLSLLPVGKILGQYHDPVLASNELFYQYTRRYFLEKERKGLLQQIDHSTRRSQNYINKNQRKLDELEEGLDKSQIGDILMANLHQIQAGQQAVTLHDFYRDQPITIKLNQKLTPQKNAERYYQKAKNQKIEIQKIQEAVEAKFATIEQLREVRQLIEEADKLRDLRKIGDTLQKKVAISTETASLPYKKFEIGGYQVLVGKNAKANDELSTKYTKKDDLWLHAKDVAGSHVIIKAQGVGFPKDVIEKAAQLAAWYSKRKSDSLCPVIYTPRKFVRKQKGSPAGQMKVDKEEVVLVTPSSYDSL